MLMFGSATDYLPYLQFKRIQHAFLICWVEEKFQKFKTVHSTEKNYNRKAFRILLNQ